MVVQKWKYGLRHTTRNHFNVHWCILKTDSLHLQVQSLISYWPSLWSRQVYWCYCYLLVQLQCDDDSWWPCLWNLTFDVGVRLLNLSLRLLQAQHSLSVVLLFIYILVSIKIEVDATTTKNALVQRQQWRLFVVYSSCASPDDTCLFLLVVCYFFLVLRIYVWYLLLMKKVYFFRVLYYSSSSRPLHSIPIPIPNSHI